MAQAESAVRTCAGCGGDIFFDGRNRWSATWYPVLDPYACPESEFGVHAPQYDSTRAGDSRD